MALLLIFDGLGSQGYVVDSMDLFFIAWPEVAGVPIVEDLISGVG